MLKKLLTGALIAGVASGVIAAALQFAFVIPMLLEGELYETGARIHFGAGSPQSPAGSPGLGDDWGRHLMTVTFNVVTYTAYGLILTGLMALAIRQGHVLNARRGIIWGLAGFIAVQLAPALGQPPELPGTITAEVGARQLWWSCTILATAVGLWLIAFVPQVWAVALAVVLMLVPQVIGAPQLDTYYGSAAPELAAHFATSSLGFAAVGWVLLGTIAGYFAGQDD
ncbi:MAG: CbtA family protein [Pseudomonadota bacterium]|nr:CbtA family protein [Pseudomonadota bacterium]